MSFEKHTTVVRIVLLPIIDRFCVCNVWSAFVTCKYISGKGNPKIYIYNLILLCRCMAFKN